MKANNGVDLTPTLKALRKGRVVVSLGLKKAIAQHLVRRGYALDGYGALILLRGGELHFVTSCPLKGRAGMFLLRAGHYTVG